MVLLLLVLCVNDFRLFKKFESTFINKSRSGLHDLRSTAQSKEIFNAGARASPRLFLESLTLIIYRLLCQTANW